MQCLAQVAARDAAVLAHQRLGARAFSGLDRVEHLQVLVLRDDEHVARGGRVGLHDDEARRRDMLVIAQDQHLQVLDAIEAGEGSRAEALMREHSRIARRNLRDALHGMPGGAEQRPLPGVQLIRRRG